MSVLTTIFVSVSAVVLLAAILAVIAVIDLREKRIPDALTLAVAALGLVIAWVAPIIPQSPLEAVVGAAVFGAVVLATAVITSLITREEAIGGGDIKLAAAAGIWLGWSWVGVFLLVACLIFLATWGVLRIAGGHERVLPFGPMLGMTLILLLLLRFATLAPGL